MLTYKYAERWCSIFDDFSKSQYSHNMSTTSTALHMLVQINAVPQHSIIEFSKTVIQFILNHFDADNTLLGLFKLLKSPNKRQINSFIATRDYCIKVLSLNHDHHIILNISPIYHLCPNYPDYYEQKQGKKLDPEAILGLLTSKISPASPIKFNLSVDAGIVFHQDQKSHNKKMCLEIKLIESGMLAILSLEGQTTSKILNWDQLGMSSIITNTNYRQDLQNIWAA